MRSSALASLLNNAGRRTRALSAAEAMREPDIIIARDGNRGQPAHNQRERKMIRVKRRGGTRDSCGIKGGGVGVLCTLPQAKFKAGPERCIVSDRGV